MNIGKTLRALAITAIPAALAFGATPALASPGGTEIGGCSTTLTNPNATACDGYFTDNVLSGNAGDVALQQEAITDLGGSWGGDWTALVNAGDVITSLTNTNQLNFGQTLFGTVIIGAHYGNIPDPNAGAQNVSVFWLFNLTTPTDHITLNNVQGWSNAALYTTDPTPGVPEPATWAMMLLGFGAAGVAVRRSRRKTQLVSQLA